MKTLLVLTLVTIGCCAVAGAQEVLWTYDPPEGCVDTSPALGDINGDGRTEVVIGTTEGLIVALDGKGSEIWRQEMRGPICFPPTVADVTGDPALEVLAMNKRGQVVCLQGATGDVIWKTDLPSSLLWGTTVLAAGDLDGDGRMELVTGLEDGNVVCLRGSGETAWISKTPCLGVQCPSIADLNGDGKPEVLVAGAGVPLMCLDHEGKELWRLPKGAAGSPFVYASAQGAPEIFVGVDGNLLAVDGKGTTLWTCPLKREMDSALAIADADGDGEAEIYVADLSGYFVCVSLQGQIRWSANVAERVRRSPSIGDIDGDGINEILVAGYSGAIHVFEPDGRLKQRVPLPNAANSTATLAVLGDSGLCVVVPMVNDVVEALRWPNTKADAKVLWPEFRYDSKRTGALVVSNAQADQVALSVDFGPMYVGPNQVKAVVDNPGKRALLVRIEVARGDNEPVVDTVESSDACIHQRVWYAVPGTEAVNFTFTCTVSDGETVLARRRKTAYLVPFVKEMADAGNMLKNTDGLCARLADARGIEDRACFLRAILDKLRGQVQVAGTLDEAGRIALRDALTGILDEARSIEMLASAATRTGTDEHGQAACVRACAANPWAPFGGTDELGEGRFGSPDLAIEAFSGETESAALNIFNLSSVPRVFQVTLENPKQGEMAVRADDVVTFHEVVDAATVMRDLSADALPRMNEANTLSVPAWGARQLWVSVDTHRLTPGEWKGTLRLKSLDVKPCELESALTITVWKPSVPEKQALHSCGWGYVESSVLKDYPEAALKDQVSHGTNVFVATIAPKATFDANGQITGEIDFEAHDAYVKQHAPFGIILFCGYQGTLRGPSSVGSEAYNKAHVQWLKAWVKHLAELGVGYDGFALYPVDEPGLSDGLVEHYLSMAKLAREADPNILMYTDPVERIGADELREMLPYVDIWCPNRTGLILTEATRDKLDIILKSGKPVWTYECAGNAKHQSPLAYYRAQAWLAWQYGLTGIGFWSYCTSQDNPWFQPQERRQDYLLVYPGRGVVSSKRWEAVRDGVEDYGLLATLRDALKARGSAAKPEDIEAANRLLGEQANAIAAFCDINTDKSDPNNPGDAGIRLIEDKRWEALRSTRKELARLLDAFSQ